MDGVPIGGNSKIFPTYTRIIANNVILLTQIPVVAAYSLSQLPVKTQELRIKTMIADATRRAKMSRRARWK